jgi:MFS family permease
MEWFYLLAIFVGLFANIGGPARQAMVADLLRPEMRVQGYGVLRVVMNLAVAIGPAIGGFIASRSYLFLFMADAVISFSVAVFVLRALPETRPMARANAAEEEKLLQTLAGYNRVLRDRIFVLFISAGVLMMLVYMQMNTTLPVYLRDVHHISEQGYGLLLSLNAAMVVIFQFHISNKVNQRPAMLMMSLGALFQVFGFSMFAYASSYTMFILAMVIITIGEMIVEPVAQGLVARMAPEDMRGRYMAVFGFTYMLSSMVGPFLAGLVIDNFDPRLLWYFAGIIGMLAVTIFYMLYHRSDTEQLTNVQTAQAMD